MPKHPRSGPPASSSGAKRAAGTDPGGPADGTGHPQDFRFLAENASEAMVVVSRDGTLLYSNPAACEQTGYTREDLDHRPLTALFEPAEVARVLAGGPAGSEESPAPRLYESLLRLPNGRSLPVELSVATTTWMGQSAEAIFLRDLSAQRRADHALREIQERWRAIASVLPDLVFVLDEEGRYVEILAAREDLLHSPVAVLKGRLMREILPAEIAEDFLRTVRRTIEEGMTQSLEYSLRLQHGERWFEGRSAPLGTVIDGRRCVVWVARDITDRKRAEQVREQQHRFIRDLVDAIPNPVFVKDREHRFLLVNDMFCRFVGRSREQLLGKSDFDFFPEEEARWFVEKDEEVLTSERPNEAEESLTPVAGEPRWIVTRKTAGAGPDGRTILIGSFTDLTDRRRVEEELLRRDRILEAVNFAAERLLRADSWEQAIAEVLERICRAAGLAQVFLCENEETDGEVHTFLRHSWEDPSRKSVTWIPAPQGYPLLKLGLAALADRLRNGQVLEVPLSEYPTRLREMFEAWGIRSVLAVPILVEGEWWGMLGFAETDREHFWAATETDALRVAGNILGALIRRERIREALRDSEKRFQDVAYAAGEYVWEVDAQLKMTFTSDRVTEILGYSREELTGLNPLDLIPADEADHIRAGYEQAVSSRQEFRNLEARIRTRSGRDVWLTVSGVPILDRQGELLGYRGVAQDVTERKRAEEELHRRDSILEAMNIAAGCLLRAQTWAECTPEILARLGAATRVSRVSFYRITPGPGQDVSAQRLANWDDPIQNLPPAPPAEAAVPLLAMGMGPWIESLRSGAVLHQPISAYPEQLQPDLLAQRARSLVGVPVLVGKDWWGSLVLIDSVAERDWTSNELEALRLYGSILGAAVQRQKVAEALEESEVKYRTVVEGTDQSIVTIREDGRFLFANSSACTELGLSSENVVGKTIWDLFPLDYAGQHIRAISSALDSGVPIVRQTQSVVQGQLGWYEVRIQPLRGADGRHRQALVVITDVNERKEAEERILSYQERLRELTSELALTEQRERRRLASELHDRIGQSLAVSKIKLGALREVTPAGREFKMLEEVWHLIDQTVQDVRTLTFQLSPPILHELGLEPALEWLMETFNGQHEISTTFHDDGQVKPLGPDLSGLLFQSVQELLINAAKHAQPSWVRVSARREGNEIQLEVEDDGVGFDPSQTGSSGQRPYGFGLFSIRERLGPLGGKMEVHSSPGHGTRVLLFAPLLAQEPDPSEGGITP